MNKIMKCSLCSSASNFHLGLKGKRADKTKLLFVLHCPDKRVVNLFSGDEGYRVALQASKTGGIILSILEHCGLSFDDIYLTNAIKCCLHKDRDPRKKEYENCSHVFRMQVQDFQPRAIVSFGEAYRVMFPDMIGKGLESSIGQVKEYNGARTLIEYHPSRIWAFLDHRTREHYEKIGEFIKLCRPAPRNPKLS